jgi:hypothetical protein
MNETTFLKEILQFQGTFCIVKEEKSYQNNFQLTYWKWEEKSMHYVPNYLAERNLTTFLVLGFDTHFSSMLFVKKYKVILFYLLKVE